MAHKPGELGFPEQPKHPGSTPDLQESKEPVREVIPVHIGDETYRLAVEADAGLVEELGEGFAELTRAQGKLGDAFSLIAESTLSTEAKKALAQGLADKIDKARAQVEYRVLHPRD